MSWWSKRPNAECRLDRASLPVSPEALLLPGTRSGRSSVYSRAMLFIELAKLRASATRSGQPATRSAGDHAHEDAVPAHEVMEQRGADMCSHQARNDRAQQVVDRERLLGEWA